MSGSQVVPWVWARVIKAATQLGSTEKMVWLEHYGLANGGHGATISASGIARRIGMSQPTIERMRRELLRFKLLRKRDRGAGRTDEWFPQLPGHCRPQGLRLVDDDMKRYAEILDEHIVKYRGTSLTDDGGSAPERGAHDRPPSPHDGGFHSATSRQGLPPHEA